MALKFKKINFQVIVKVLGYLLILEGMLMSVSLVVSAAHGDYSVDFNKLLNPKYDFCAILVSILITVLVGVFLSLFTKKRKMSSIGKIEGFIIVVFSWITMSVFGALPYILSGVLPNFTDAFFESISGFTTTGVSTIIDVECIPKGVLLWRAMTAWIGGMGIIFFSVAIIPSLGVGNYMLTTLESTGMMRNKIHPRVKETAKRLWGVYFGLTVLCALALWLNDMDVYDAVYHSFATIATCGFSSYNASAQNMSPSIQYILIAFMLISSVSFSSLYFLFTFKFKKGRLTEECKVFLGIVIVVTLYIFISLLAFNVDKGASIETIFRDSLFQVASIITTTGFVSVDYLTWPSSIWFVLFLLCFVGGCSGSTSGGVKVIRYVMLVKNCFLELKRQVHPLAVLPVRYNKETVPQSTIYNVHAFFVFFLLVFVVGALLFSMMGIDFETSIGSSISSLGNVGPSIGQVGPVDNYVGFPLSGKWLMAFLMLLGRLELFTVLVLFNKSFWTK